LAAAMQQQQQQQQHEQQQQQQQQQQLAATSPLPPATATHCNEQLPAIKSYAEGVERGGRGQLTGS